MIQVYMKPIEPELSSSERSYFQKPPCSYEIFAQLPSLSFNLESNVVLQIQSALRGLDRILFAAY
jgi:hypothetical protein